MEINWLALIVAAFVPTFTGFIWYNPRVFGEAWIEVSGVSQEKRKSVKLPIVFGLSLMLSFLLAYYTQFLTIHQTHLYSLLMNQPGFNDPTSEVGMLLTGLMDKYGSEFRTFKHGALHGAVAGILIVLPVLGINALFEHKGWKYILINVGYWTLTLTIMGGIVCQWR